MKITKRILSGVLAMAIILGIMPSSFGADATAVTAITTIEQLEAMTGGEYRLEQDLTLPDSWIPIDFSGTLDGNGHVLTLSGQPIFNTISPEGSVTNLIVSGHVSGPDSIGALGKTCYGSVSNCFFRADVTLTKGSGFFGNVGGAVGLLDGGTISNCLFIGSVNFLSMMDCIGGAAGQAENNGVFKNCYWSSNPDFVSDYNPAATCKKLTDDEIKGAASTMNANRDGGLEWGLGASGYPLPGGTGGSGSVEADKTALNKAIAQAGSLVSSQYTEKSWQALVIALDKAAEISANTLAFQRDVDRCERELTLAIASLIIDNTEETADIRAKFAKLLQDASLKVRSDLYTLKSWLAFEKALTEAQLLYDSPSATETQLAQGMDELAKEMDSPQEVSTALVERPSDEKLITFIENANDLKNLSDSSGYYQLKNDIALPEDWAGVEIAGTLDGNGHEIILSGTAPVFSTIAPGATVQNLGLIGGKDHVGGGYSLAETSSGRILNSYSKVNLSARVWAGGLVGTLDGGLVYNCYFSGDITATSAGGIAINHNDGAVASCYWLETSAGKMAAQSGYLPTSCKSMELSDFRSDALRGRLNKNIGSGKGWTVCGSDGFPWLGDNQDYIPPKGDGVFTYPVYFQALDGSGVATGESRLLDESGLSVSLSDMNSDSDVGILSIPDYNGNVLWKTNSYDVGFVGGISGLVSLVQKGSVTITAYAADEIYDIIKPEEILARFKLEVSTGDVEDIRFYIDGALVQSGGSHTLLGSTPGKVTAQVKKIGSDYTDLPQTSIYLKSSSSNVSINNRTLMFKSPGEAQLSLSALGQTIKVKMVSQYVAVSRITPGIDIGGNEIFIHERNPNSTGRKDFLPVDRKNVTVEPANASYKDNFTLVSSNPDIADYMSSMVVKIVPYKAGAVTFTATSKDPLLDTQKTGQAQVEFKYFNPLLKVESQSEQSISEGVTKALDLTLTGSKSKDGYHVSEAKIDWTYTSKDGGEIEIFRDNEAEYMTGSTVGEWFVSSDSYKVRGIKKGTVTAVGVPYDTTGGAKPITLTFTVNEGVVEKPLDIPQLIRTGISQGSSYLQSSEKTYAFGHEWEIFSLLTGGRGVSSKALEAYLKSISATYKGDVGNSETKPTTIARVILALTAARKDGASFDGIDFISMLTDSPRIKEGANEPMWALIALDSNNYSIPMGSKWSREALIDQLLTYQNLSSGGFGLIDNKTTGIDITAMSIQALAPYYEQEKVKIAVDKAVLYLKNNQSSQGGFEENCESAVQVLVALSTVGIDALKEENGFTKGVNRNILANIISFAKSDAPYGFAHTQGTLAQGMTTSQAIYGLEAYERFQNQGKKIYDLTEITAKTQLEAMVKDTKRLFEGDYTAQSWSVVKSALEKSEKLISSSTVDEALDNSAAELYNSVRALEAKPSDKPSEPTPTNISVTFRLIGDDLHGENASHTKYKTWISTTSYTLAKGSTVYDIFHLALSQNNMKFDESQPGYIGGIQAPSVLGGYWLREFDNGPMSGWKYLVNGTYPGVGLHSMPLYDGDTVIWRYVDNHTDDFDNTDKWQEAVDIAPSSPSISGGADIGSVALAPSVIVDKDGNGLVKIDESTLEKAISAASIDNSTKLAISPVGGENAKKITVELPTSVAKSAANNGKLGIDISTSIGNVEISTKALSSITKQAEGNSLCITMEKVSQNDAIAALKLSGGKELSSLDLSKSLSVSLTITSNNKSITSFEGESLSLTLPACEGMEKGGTYKIIVLSSDGKAEVLDGRVVLEGGKLVVKVITNHLSTFIVTGEKAFVMPFIDVKIGDWYYDAVEFSLKNKLFEGVDSVSFAPNNAMSRSMAITVVWRMAGSPKGQGENSFSDVPNDAWYSQAVIWGKEQGIIQGSNGNFNPDDSITREQLAAMLYRYARVEPKDVTGELKGFSDLGNLSVWAYEYVNWAVDLGFLQGSDNMLRPEKSATRAEMAVLVQRFMEKIGK